MADRTMSVLKVIGLILTASVIMSSAVIAVTVASATANEAKTIAQKAEDTSQKNAEGLEYFKGKIEGTLDGVQVSIQNMASNQRDASARYDKRVDKVETNIDELLKIMVRFKRAGDDE